MIARLQRCQGGFQSRLSRRLSGARPWHFFHCASNIRRLA
jgi:hypothetical protein